MGEIVAKWAGWRNAERRGPGKEQQGRRASRPSSKREHLCKGQEWIRSKIRGIDAECRGREGPDHPKEPELIPEATRSHCKVVSRMQNPWSYA